MARSARRKGKKRGKKSSKSSLSTPMIVGMVVFAMSMPIFLSLYVVAFALLLPAVVAFVIDNSPRKPLARCVSAVNLCGFLPAGIEIVINSPGSSMESIAYILGDVYYWFYAYGAAAVGWLLFTGVPPLIGRAVAMKAQNRVSELRKKQQKLVEHWGPEVAAEAMPSLGGGMGGPAALEDGSGGDLGELGDLGDLDDLGDFMSQPNKKNNMDMVPELDDFPDLEAEIDTGKP